MQQGNYEIINKMWILYIYQFYAQQFKFIKSFLFFTDLIISRKCNFYLHDTKNPFGDGNYAKFFLYGSMI